MKIKPTTALHFVEYYTHEMYENCSRIVTEIITISHSSLLATDLISATRNTWIIKKFNLKPLSPFKG